MNSLQFDLWETAMTAVLGICNSTRIKVAPLHYLYSLKKVKQSLLPTTWRTQFSIVN